ncbi:Nitrogen regulatory protein PII [Parasponia andersonii]|uniref:Nitrogen regulatory protein PII n=1 Tax=Parasponia andersonii TaxID=3476 RepID=A0A2P5CL63_PARAD|nr:Nitrogen regulatory protein PII [Parasponia andersonii]
MGKAGAISPIDAHFKRLPPLKGCHFSHTAKPNVTLLRNASIPPVIRAHSSPAHAPPPRLLYSRFPVLQSGSDSQALLKMGIRGVTVSDVRGFGAQGGSTERQGGSEFSEDNFVAKVKMEIVVNKNQVEAVIDRIIEEARTGEIGDGKIFLVPVADVIRVRTGERGEEAERMTGGRSDMSIAA